MELRGQVVQAQPGPPIMITLAEPKSDLTGLSDVLLGSLGLAGVLVLCSVLLAAVFSVGLFWWRSRSASQDAPPDDLHIV